MSYISILTLEQRFCPINEIRKFSELVKKNNITKNNQYSGMTLESAVDKVIMKYPRSGSVNNLQDYFNEYFGCCLDTYCLNTDVEEFKEIVHEEKKLNAIFGTLEPIAYDTYQNLKPKIYAFLRDKGNQEVRRSYADLLLYILNLYINVISWGERNIWGFTLEHNLEVHKVIRDRVSIILELANYKQEYLPFNEELKYAPVLFIKRNTDLDSILPLVSPDIRIDLLTYFDFRVEKNVQEKQAILKRLADYIEPERERHAAVNRKLTSKVFQLFNTCNIRHANDKQMRFESDEEQIEYYDICFNLVLHLLREGEIKEFYEKIDMKIQTFSG